MSLPEQRAEIARLVRLLQSDSEVEQAIAAAALCGMHQAGGDAFGAAIAAAGGVPALLLIRINHGQGAVPASTLVCNLASSSPARCQAIVAGGGVELLVGCLGAAAIPIRGVQPPWLYTTLPLMRAWVWQAWPPSPPSLLSSQH